MLYCVFFFYVVLVMVSENWSVRDVSGMGEVVGVGDGTKIVGSVLVTASHCAWSSATACLWHLIRATGAPVVPHNREWLSRKRACRSRLSYERAYCSRLSLTNLSSFICTIGARATLSLAPVTSAWCDRLAVALILCLSHQVTICFFFNVKLLFCYKCNIIMF